MVEEEKGRREEKNREGERERRRNREMATVLRFVLFIVRNDAGCKPFGSLVPG